MLHVNENGAFYCETCEMWLNGLTQWEDHKIGRKHRKNVRRRGPPPTCWNSYAGDEGNRKDSPRDDSNGGKRKGKPGTGYSKNNKGKDVNLYTWFKTL